ncbi:Ig-like domain-containing protein [Microbacterium sp. Marseille-Q6965]|uniref:Ig-like domain-containing protein n=1 Tax=Microbacterium sp. Marseille-Q6965 TaxID=2965072 RepID=UPI0021B76761|nr:Ig-like domain-containing protein [Microbacterium sp. Marseille-Q6965]
MRRALWGWITAGVVTALVLTLAVVWPGLDAQRTPDTEPGVWALQTGQTVRYARVNTEVRELDTVRAVSNPSGIVQTERGAFLFAESDSRLLEIDTAMPVDFDDEAQAAAERTPGGTVDVATAGDYAAYLTDTGTVFAGVLGEATVLVEPHPADEEAEESEEDGRSTPSWTADAITIDDRGVLYAYSADDSLVTRYDVSARRLLGEDSAPSGLSSEGLQLTAVAGTWFLVDATSGDVWRRGQGDPFQPGLGGVVAAGTAASEGDAAYVADDLGLVELPTGGEPRRVFDAPGGAPAAPRVFNGDVYAAWLDIAGGTMWRMPASGDRDGTQIALDYAGRELPEERAPVFTSSGSRMILNETRSGWVWTMPDGALVPSSQEWEPEDELEEETVQSQEQAEVVTDPRPPVAEDDAFGVRPGTLVSLPVLLNDHDPNQDVLTVMEGSVSGLPEEFGRLSVTDDGGRIAVDVAPDATGSATFQYQVVDGTQEGGRASETATVTLTVAEGNGAPVWCGVAGCLAEWPSPEVAPGGTVTVPVLDGWVDPEGDPVILLDVANPSGEGAASVTPRGEVVYQHSNSSAGSTTVELHVTVADTRGAQTTRSLAVKVDPNPQLRAESFAVLDSVGTISVDVEPHVTGTAGRLAVESVRVLDNADATASPSAFGTGFDFTAEEDGVYLVRYTVTDGASSAEATARITLLPEDAPAQLAAAPVTAFVHQGADITLDVMPAISNPTRRVLMLSEPQVAPADGATLQVDVVGQSALRITGTTADGEAGLLGTVRYTVSDGTLDDGAQVTGEASVFLLPPATDLSPIAVDDSVVVRAGAQIDIPVLDNDVAPSGRSLMLDPSAVQSSTDKALAFASGSVIRYLAPEEAGDYRVDYSVYAAGAPSLADSSAVTIRVVGDEENRAPQPHRLDGRVLAGQSVEIPLQRFGADPDGDTVELDRILTQPDVGSASISADGESIVYSSAPGSFGQVSFTYQVVDGQGLPGTGRVRVGVMAAEADPRPVLYTDYVQVQGAEDAEVTVTPLANDIDPLGGELSLENVVPDVPATLADGTENPRYVELTDRLTVEGDTLRVRPGAEFGTISYLYDVETSGGNSARGRIVVYVTRERVPDYPIVSDTRLTLETRDRFEDGVDVVDGSVAWSGGSVDDLELGLWGEQEGVEVSGNRISGELTPEARVVPFQLAGVSTSGDEVAGYAFLRVPGDRAALAEKADAPPIEVQESESVEFDMRDRVAAPRGRTLEVGDEVAASGARSAATCTVRGSVVTYAAGDGAPWSDACAVPVRLDGDEAWTVLSVGIRVIPNAPQPDLQAAAVTVSPGDTKTFDLQQMVTWPGGRVGDPVRFGFEFGGSALRATASGSTVTVTATDSARPGTQERATVTSTSHEDVAPASLTFTVGEAPSQLPRGGTAEQLCRTTQGGSCDIRVVGIAGETNPLPGTPLRLVSVQASQACSGVSFSVASDTHVRASWASGTPGATCRARFAVEDAQGRVSGGEAMGTVLLDLHGLPNAPGGVRQVGYGDGEVMLRVDPGTSRAAYPALQGFRVTWNGQEVASCSADGACPVISAPNGERRDYVVRAVNSTGESEGSVQTTAWAFRAPAAPRDARWTPTVTRGEGNLVDIEVEITEPQQTGAIDIWSAATNQTTTVEVNGRSRVQVRGYNVGSNNLTDVTITPISIHEIPAGLAGVKTGESITRQMHGVGAPQGLGVQASATNVGDGRSRIDATASAGSGSSAPGVSVEYGFVLDNGWCSPRSSSPTASFTEDDGREYRIQACARTVYQGQEYGSAWAETFVRAIPVMNPPEGATFRVRERPFIEGNQAQWRIVQVTPPSRRNAPNGAELMPEQVPQGSTVYGRPPEIAFWWQHEQWPEVQSAPAYADPETAPYQLRASVNIESSCVGGGAPPKAVLGEHDQLQLPDGTRMSPTITELDRTYYAGWFPVAAEADGSVPTEADRVVVRSRVSWGGAYGLEDATLEVSGKCEPAREPAPSDPTDPPAEG